MRDWFAAAFTIAVLSGAALHAQERSTAAGQPGSSPGPATQRTTTTRDAGPAGGQAPTRSAAPTARRTPAATRTGESLEEIVDRVRKRLAQEDASRVSKPGVRAPSAHAPEPSPRIKLVWRPGVVWPAELVASSGAATTAEERVRLSWDIK